MLERQSERERERVERESNVAVIASLLALSCWRRMSDVRGVTVTVTSVRDEVPDDILCAWHARGSREEKVRGACVVVGVSLSTPVLQALLLLATTPGTTASA